MTLMKVCSYTGCKALVSYGIQYCTNHLDIAEQERKERYRDYKAKRTDKREEAFYCSKEWEQVRELAKSKTNYIDVYQYYVGDVGKIVTGDVVHHVVEIKDIDGWELRLDINNLIYLTYESHSIIHAAYNRSARDKMAMQKLLLELMERYVKEFK